MRTIRVTGKGQIRVKPDMTRITLSLEGLYPEYGETLRRSAEDTEKIKDLLTELGFARTDLKTLNFNVDTEYERYQERTTYKQRFVGYKYHHQMKVEFDSDNDRLGMQFNMARGQQNCGEKDSLVTCLNCWDKHFTHMK